MSGRQRHSEKVAAARCTRQGFSRLGGRPLAAPFDACPPGALIMSSCSFFSDNRSSAFCL